MKITVSVKIGDVEKSASVENDGYNPDSVGPMIIDIRKALMAEFKGPTNKEVDSYRMIMAASKTMSDANDFLTYVRGLK